MTYFEIFQDIIAVIAIIGMLYLHYRFLKFLAAVGAFFFNAITFRLRD